MSGTDRSRDELLEQLRQLAAELGKSPSQHEMDEAEGYPSSQVYKLWFGSWSNAKHEAGLPATYRGQRRYTREELICQLQVLASRLGREPEIADVRHRDELPSFQTFVNRFGSWTKAKHEAGIETKGPHETEYSKEELLDCLRDLRDELGRVPRRRDLDAKDDYPSYSPYLDKFGSLLEAMREAGLELEGYRKREYSDEELVKELRALKDELGHVPTTTELDAKDDYPCYWTYYDRFGSWSEAKKQAGIEE